MKMKLSEVCRNFQEEISSIKIENDTSHSEDKEKLLEFLALSLKYYQSLKLWLDEPRLHEESVSLHALPIQYDPHRLNDVFKADKVIIKSAYNKRMSCVAIIFCVVYF
jgi:hypothetical protein